MLNLRVFFFQEKYKKKIKKINSMQLIPIAGMQLDDSIEIPLEWTNDQWKKANDELNVFISHSLSPIGYCLDTSLTDFPDNGAWNTNGILITVIRTIWDRFHIQN